MDTSAVEPAWLTSKVDQRFAQMKESLPDPTKLSDPPATVMTPLTDPPEDKRGRERWESSCDNCGAYDPRSLWIGHAQREWGPCQVLVMFGSCERCKHL